MTATTTVGDALAAGRNRLRASGVDTAGLEAAVLLGHVLGVSRAWLMAHPDAHLTSPAAHMYSTLLDRRLAGEPIAYLTGAREFYGLSLAVSPAVLVPRPETELLVERAIAALRSWPTMPLLVVDVGVGSGAIAISLAWNVPTATVLAVDVSLPALRVARDNVRAHDLSARVHLVAGDLLDWLAEPVHLITANLPYLRPDQANPTIVHEPAVALYAGADGFALYRRLLSSIPALLHPGGTLLAEIDPSQRDLALAYLAQSAPGWPARIERDSAGRHRLVVLSRPA